jgi:polyhydroxybutyrate depolymerase
MTRRLACFAAIASALLMWSLRPFAADDGEPLSWKVDGQLRKAIVRPPTASSPGGKAPLVLSFHGHGDNMDNFQLTNMHRAWPQAIVVYFQGLPSADGLSGWQTERGQDHDRDLKLVDTAISSIRQSFKVDDTRIYATGFSNGAGFTYLLWAERPSVFAAFAAVAARLRPSVELQEPRPMFHVAGERDRTIPFEIQQRAIEAAKAANRATEQTPCGAGCTLWSGGAAPVMTWIHSSGHVYPDQTSDLIAKFFRDHSLRPSSH